MDLGRDELTRQLREVLTSDRHALPDDLVPLADVHRGAVRRRRRRRSVAGAAAAVVLVAVAVPLGLRLSDPGPAPSTLAGETSTRSTAAPEDREASPTGQPSPSAATASPSVRAALPWGGARAVSVTATSESTLVVLGVLPHCADADCLRLALSSDGGATFTPLPSVPVDTRNTSNGATSAVQDIRFGSGNDGWLFGDHLWATHDGGGSWRQLELPGPVTRLEAAAGQVWALVGSADRLQLWTVTTSGDEWRRVPGVSVTGPADLAVQGSHVIVAGAGRSPVWVGDGKDFTRRANPCRGALGTRLSATTGVWATCVTGTAATVSTSADGVAWRPVRTDPAQGALPSSVRVGARSSTDAVVGLGAAQVAQLSTDGLLTDVRRPPAGPTTYVGFTTAEIGYAIAGGRLWRTDDGGDTWSGLTPR